MAKQTLKHMMHFCLLFYYHRFNFIFCVFLWIFMFTICMCSQKTVGGIGSLELEMVVSHHLGHGNQTQTSARTASAFTVWVITLSPPLLFVPLFFYFKFLYCIESLPTCMFVYHLCGRYLQRLEKGIISLELEFLMIVNYYVCWEPNPISSASVLKCWATSPAPIFVCAFETGSYLVFLAVLELPV